jgi:thioredoxin 1
MEKDIYRLPELQMKTFRKMTFTTLSKQQMSSNVPLPSNVITELSKDDFVANLQNNRGAFVIKFGAEWCGPCKMIQPLVNEWMSRFPENVQGAVIDIDDNFEIYALLKSKRQINGVPAIMCYKRGNLTAIPDHIVVGTDVDKINQFFRQCISYGA